MEELFAIKDFYNLYEQHSTLILLGVMIVAFHPLLFITRRIVTPNIYKVAKLKGEQYEKTLDKYRITKRIFHLFAALYLTFWEDIFHKTIISAAAIKFVDIIVRLYLVFAVSTLLMTLIDIATDLYNKRAVSQRVPIGLHAQIVKILIGIFSILTILSIVLGMSISSLYTNIGAAAAILTFVFKDAAVGLVASLQLTFQDVIKVGDWVTLPNYNADGTIEKITITVVMVRNFDKTYTTVPTYAFLTTGVKNWRAMFESGGRRIKRSLKIDINTVKICDQALLNRISQIPHLKKLVTSQPGLFKVENAIANIAIFRKYIAEYLRFNENIHQGEFTCMVRELEATEYGLPIELYFFTKDTEWINYEIIQADIFDHLLGIMPQFELKAFQAANISNLSPTLLALANQKNK